MYVILILVGVVMGYMLLLPIAIKLGGISIAGWAVFLLYALFIWLFGGEPQVMTLSNEPYPKLDFKEYLEGTLAANGGDTRGNRLLAYLVYPGVFFGAMLHNLDVRLSKRSTSSA
ncbi:MAG: hypothetical protein PHW75_01530 [Patescibacteria group bacterium]|nr:hypothetical protein [Patescibacteria group bacterium]